MYPFVLVYNVLICDCFNEPYALQALLFKNTFKTFSSVTGVDLLKTEDSVLSAGPESCHHFPVYLKIVNSVYMLLETEES